MKVSKAYESLKHTIVFKDRAISELKATGERISRNYEDLKKMS